MRRTETADEHRHLECGRSPSANCFHSAYDIDENEDIPAV